MKIDTIEDIVAYLISVEFVKTEQLSGYSDEEITHLETLISASLPAAFRMFLKIMGHGVGQLFVGSDIFFLNPSHYVVMREYANNLLTRNGQPFTLPDDAFVFMSHQGWVFAYFLLNSGQDDPPVYSYGETDEGDVPQRSSDTFTQFIIACMELQMEQRKKLEKYKKPTS